MNLRVLQPSSVSLKDPPKATRLLHTLNPMIQCSRLDCGGVVAFLFDEHLLQSHISVRLQYCSLAIRLQVPTLFLLNPLHQEKTKEKNGKRTQNSLSCP